MNARRDNRHSNINRKEEKKVVSTSVNQQIRYRAGMKPDWIDNNSSDEDIFNEEGVESSNLAKIVSSKAIELNEHIIQQIENTDRRMKRLADNKNRVEKKEDKDKIDPKIKRRREIFKSEIIQNNVAEEGKNNIEESTTTTTDIMNKQIDGNTNSKYSNAVTNSIEVNIKRKKQEAIINIGDNEDELLELLEEAKESEIINENSNSSILESDAHDSQDEEEEILMRPVFITKEERRTIQDDTQKEIEENEILEQEAKLKENRKKHTTELVKKYIEKDKTKDAEKTEDSESNQMPDDTDNLDDLEEYEKWKLRELRRIKRQVEEDEMKLNEKLEIDRRRKLTNEQRKEENLRLGSDDTLRPFKSKINFMQRYYHKGAFFQQESQGDLEHVFSRDYNMPIAEEKRDLSALPKILQKRRGNLFKKGQSKYTHLTAEDTTCFDPNFKIPENIVNKMLNNFGGYKAKDCFELSRKKNN